MQKLSQLLVLAVLACATAACTVERDAHLYPLDEETSGTAVLQGQIVGHGKGHGTMDVSMPGGEHLQGEYSIVFDGSAGFGSIFGTAYGNGGSVSVSGTTTNFAISGKGEGSASLAGDRGTSMQCEFLNENFTGHGYGACRSSKSGTYRLIY